jgi:amino acid transporter
MNLTEAMETTPPPEGDEGARRLGTFGGVFTPSILTILGVIMYLRLGWVVGNAGLGGALIIILVSHLISLSTGLSVSSIATNRTVGAGGAYFMISRSLGASAGAAVGIPLFFAQALSVTFYIVGFTESLGYIIGENPPWFLEPMLLSSVVNVLLLVVAVRSAEAAIKIQYVVMAAIGLSLVAFFGGSSETPPETIEWFTDDGESFAAVFAVFFPAVTGIMAGVSMSGDLKDSRRSLPRGTLFAILAGFIVYMVFPVFLAMNFDLESLRTNNQAAFDMSLSPQFIYIGVWGATLSSAVGSILAAPRTLQALAIDKLAPRLFAKGAGPANEPRNGLIFTFLLAQAGIMVGSLDLIAPVLTMFFLATYGVTNLASALERWVANPSFRPTFTVPALVSFSGAIACFYVMSIINLGAMVAAVVICVIIYMQAKRKNLTTTFGDTRYGIWAALVRTSLRHLHRTEYHPLNWRPNLLIFGGPPSRRRHLLELGSVLVQERGIVSYMQLLRGSVAECVGERREVLARLDGLTEHYPNTFFRVDLVPDVYKGMVTITQSYGIGSLEANTVLVGWLSKRDRAQAYFRMLNDLHLLHNSLLTLRYDPRRGFGLQREIHVWWGGLQANGAMMLLLAYLITSHPRWSGARVVGVTVVDTQEQAAQAEVGLRRVFDAARLEAVPRVLLRQAGQSIDDMMAAESGEADLVLMGLRLPENLEDSEAVFDAYNARLSRLPSTILVNSGLEFEGAPVLFDE